MIKVMGSMRMVMVPAPQGHRGEISTPIIRQQQRMETSSEHMATVGHQELQQ
jgi:hypothetical protein